MCKFCKKSVKLFSMVVGVLFVVYFWNLDQKVLGLSLIHISEPTRP